MGEPARNVPPAPYVGPHKVRWLRAVDRAGVSPGARLIAGCYTRLPSYPVLYTSLASLQAITGRGPSQNRRYLRELEKAGLLKRAQWLDTEGDGRQGANDYTVVLPESDAQMEGGGYHGRKPFYSRSRRERERTEGADPAGTPPPSRTRARVEMRAGVASSSQTGEDQNRPARGAAGPLGAASLSERDPLPPPCKAPSVQAPVEPQRESGEDEPATGQADPRVPRSRKSEVVPPARGTLGAPELARARPAGDAPARPGLASPRNSATGTTRASSGLADGLARQLAAAVDLTPAERDKALRQLHAAPRRNPGGYLRRTLEGLRADREKARELARTRAEEAAATRSALAAKPDDKVLDMRESLIDRIRRVAMNPEHAQILTRELGEVEAEIARRGLRPPPAPPKARRPESRVDLPGPRVTNPDTVTMFLNWIPPS
jgi:hypothetical protein